MTNATTTETPGQALGRKRAESAVAECKGKSDEECIDFITIYRDHMIIAAEDLGDVEAAWAAFAATIDAAGLGDLED